MAKVIKLKQSDITKLVSNVIKEAQEFDDFDTKIQPEELPGQDTHMLQLAQDDEGNYYILDTESGEPQIVAKTK
jgi:hypothetical protein